LLYKFILCRYALDAKLLDFVTHEVEEDILHAKQKLYNIMTEGHVKGRGKNKVGLYKG
jgi:hypothetical protein